jgi:signal transduction histidine kinase
MTYVKIFFGSVMMIGIWLVTYKLNNHFLDPLLYKISKDDGWLEYINLVISFFAALLAVLILKKLSIQNLRSITILATICIFLGCLFFSYIGFESLQDHAQQKDLMVVEPEPKDVAVMVIKPILLWFFSLIGFYVGYRDETRSDDL